MRWLGPALCLLAAAGTFVSLHLSDHGPVWVLVGLDRLVGSDPATQASWTWRIFALVGAVWSFVVWRLPAQGRGDAAADP